MEHTQPAPAPVSPSPVLSRLLARAKVLARFVSIQLIVQGLGVASGILLVRLLSQREYAYFTIASSMQSTMNILADTGLSVGLSAIGGKVWQNPHRFGQLIVTTVRLRRYLALAAAVVVTPILLALLVQKGSSLPYAGLIGLVVLLGLNFQLTNGVLITVPRLLSQIRRVQTLDLAAALVRVAWLAGTYWLILNAATATLATVAMLVTQYLLLKRWVPGSIDVNAPFNDADRNELLRISRSQAPSVIFYCLQGQIVVWLISAFGSTQNVAEVGALGRLGVIFAVVGSVMTGIVLPGFSKCHAPWLLKRRYLQIIASFTVFGLALIATAAVMPDALLWILGSKYASLQRELLLTMILAVVNAIAGAMWSLNAAKAWVEYSWLTIPGTLLTQAILLTCVDISSPRGALLFGILSYIPAFALNIWLTTRGLRRASLPA